VTGVQTCALPIFAVSESYLVKTAFYGGDPNWGRILAAAGYSDAKIDVTRMKVTINGIPIFENGAGILGNRGSVASELTGSEIMVEIDLGLGGKDYTMWTCDLSHDYVKINAHYTT
jgi:glutamate N-acetyltransferase/amino-acid N-acetyltransferase